MFSEVSFRKGMVFYNFADYWTGFVFLVKTVFGNSKSPTELPNGK